MAETTTADRIQVVRLTPETWPMFDALVVRHNGIFGGCWCTWFHPDSPNRGPGAEGSRTEKKMYVDCGVAHAALLVQGDEVVAWAEYGTPAELPNLHHRKQYDAEADLVPDYRVTCIFVDKRHRRRGLAERALRGALDLIAQEGGGIVEGYPHIPGEKKMSSSFLYNGTRAMYERCGFEFVRPKGLKNTVMRQVVAAAG
ncbi:GNAT family N-acetyltransferase [Nocardioides aurantiacus]|uniref:GNAT family N-acetyltransferase n=1 Tax=Nocardioides aurantiacus TaxID=86796 RepID=UPI00403F5BC2